MNNISRKKQQKEMEQATQEMYAEQEMTNGTPSPFEQFVAQYGGFVPPYGMGGNVKMYGKGDKIDPSAPGKGVFEQSTFEEALPYVGPLVGLGYSLLQNPFTLNPKDYEVTDRVNPYEDTYVPDYDLYNTAKYSMRQAAGASGAYLAAMQGLYNRFAKGTAEEKRKVKEANQARKMAADVENLKIQQENAKTRMTLADYNEKQRSERTNAILQSLIGENGLTAMAMKARENALMENALKARYPVFFGFEKWNEECPEGKKKDANGNCV
jgi:hypothetical protein